MTLYEATCSQKGMEELSKHFDECYFNFLKNQRKNTMTATQYLKETGVATSTELIHLAREDKKAFDELKEMAREQAAHNGIVLEEPSGEKK